MTTYQMFFWELLMNWETPPKPSEWAESKLIEAILDDTFPIGSNLPGERDLAAQMGITRPTLRETLQRLARDGWLEIRHGHPTRVRDYWLEGQLAVLVAMSQRPKMLAADFVPHLLEVRLAMAPHYTREAVSHNAQQVADFLTGYTNLADSPEIFSQADWDLHHRLTVLSQNPVYTLMLNGFRDLYLEMGRHYFGLSETRQASANFYQELLAAVRQGDAGLAEQISARVMKASIDYWNRLK